MNKNCPYCKEYLKEDWIKGMPRNENVRFCSAQYIVLYDMGEECSYKEGDDYHDCSLRSSIAFFHNGKFLEPSVFVDEVDDDYQYERFDGSKRNYDVTYFPFEEIEGEIIGFRIFNS